MRGNACDRQEQKHSDIYMNKTDNRDKQEQNNNTSKDTCRTGQGDSEKFSSMDNTLQEDRKDSTGDDKQAATDCRDNSMNDDSTASE